MKRNDLLYEFTIGMNFSDFVVFCAGQIHYNKVGYWLHTIRFTRNFCSHQSLRLIGGVTASPSGHPTEASEIFIRIPVSPAQSEYTSRDMHTPYPFMSGTDPLSEYRAVSGNGYIRVSVAFAIAEMSLIASIIGADLYELAGLCMPD